MFCMELDVHTAMGMRKIFMMPGFFSAGMKLRNTRVHKHSYTEIHVVTGGDLLYSIDNVPFLVHAGEMLAIPAKIYHRYESIEGEACISSFLVDFDIEEPSIYSLPHGLMDAYFSELNHCESTEDFTRISPYLSLLLAEIIPEKILPRKITDYHFIIDNYLSSHIGDDICMADLAKELCLSDRQAERLIKETTGNTFRQEITELRFRAAKYLLEYTDMSACEVAEQVGYHSYTSLWRVLKAKHYTIPPSKQEKE